MLKNYFKIALRNIKRYKIYSFINIAGLAIGIACALFVFLLLRQELSFDKHHEKADRISQVFQKYYFERGTETSDGTSAPIAQGLRETYPDILNTTRMGKPGELLLKHGSHPFVETEVICADPSIFEMFTIPFIKGNPQTALANPLSIVFTEEMAVKYFGDEDPLLKTIRINNRFDFIVTGIIKNLPYNSHRRFKFLVPFDFLGELGHDIKGVNNSFFTYVLLPENIPRQEVSQKISDYPQKGGYTYKVELFLVPLTQIRQVLHGGASTGIVYFSFIIGFMILVIACINFMNLATARSLHRAKEVGLRKVIGASRVQLVRQFLGESILFVIIAYFTALLLVELFLPTMNRLSGRHVTVDFLEVQFILASIAIILFTGITAGSYPALFLSSYKPIKVLKENFASGSKGALFRKVLISFQFMLSAFFAICITFITFQFHYMKHSDLGFGKENILYLPIKGDIRKNFESAKNELLQHSNIINVTTASHMPFLVSNFELDWGAKDNEKNVLIASTQVGYDYTETFDMKMAQGRFYSREFITDPDRAIVINETAVKKLGLESPVGKSFWFQGKQHTIIGVVQDFFFFPIARFMGPLMLRLNPVNNFMIIRIKPDISGATGAFHIEDFIRRVLNGFYPDYPFEINFLDEYVEKEGDPVGRILNAMLYLTLLGIFISCMGLFGLSSFMVERRTNEIGIRKVLGASVGHIIRLFSKEYVKLLLIANLFAWPLAYLTMNKFLQMLAYRISLSIWIFFAVSAFVCFIAILTVSFQTFKAALANPVEALRYE